MTTCWGEHGDCDCPDFHVRSSYQPVVLTYCKSETFNLALPCTRYQVPVIFQQALRTTHIHSRANVLVNWCAAPLTAHVSIHRVHARAS